MGSHGHLELILEDGTIKKAEVYFDGPLYIANVIQDLAILVGKENKSISDLDLQNWFRRVTRLTDSKVTESYDRPLSDYFRIDQKEGKIEVNPSFVYDGDEISEDNRRLVVDLENPKDYFGFLYDAKALKAALKILNHRDSLYWKDGPFEKKYFSDTIDAPVPFRAEYQEMLLVNSVNGKVTLFEMGANNFRERPYNQ